MQMSTYLFFDGTCEEAMTFYERTFNGRIAAIMRNADAPADARMPGDENLVMHARLEIGGMVLLASDCPPSMFNKPQGFRVMAGFDTAEEGEKAFNALAEGGSVEMPFQQTFWAHRFGMVTDRFGTPWMINCEKAR